MKDHKKMTEMRVFLVNLTKGLVKGHINIMSLTNKLS